MSIKKIEQNLETKLKDMFDSEQFTAKMTELKEIENDKEYQFKVVVTTEGVDRDGETIKADGIDFKAYMENPVVLVDHSYKIESIVGKTLKIYQEGGKTIAEGVFAKGVEKAELIRALYNQGFVKTVSIGFIAKKRDDGDRTVIEKSEMLEFSFVAVPANPEALSLDGKLYQKCLDQGIIKEYTTEIVKAEDLNVGDNVTFRNVHKYTENGVEKENIYPDIKRLPRMGKIIQIIDDGSEVITWGETAIIGTKENPIYTIQSYISSEDGPKSRTMNVTMSKYTDLKIERIVSSDEIEKGFKEFSNEDEVDMKDVLNIMNSLRDDVSEMKTSLKTSAEDNAEENNRKAAQELVNGVSAYLAKTKKSAK